MVSCKRLIPHYAYFPICLMILANLFTYFITPIWTNKLHHYTMTTNIDECIPFLPVFVIPYILAYFQWILGYIGISRTEEKYCKEIMYGEAAAKIIVCALFTLVPSTMSRAVFENTGLCTNLVAIIYKLDAPINLFPSIHCLESWICFRGSLNHKYFDKRYSVIMGIATSLVFCSTVFIKQHVVFDIIGAVIVAEVGLRLVKSSQRNKKDDMLA